MTKQRMLRNPWEQNKKTLSPTVFIVLTFLSSDASILTVTFKISFKANPSKIM